MFIFTICINTTLELFWSYFVLCFVPGFFVTALLRDNLHYHAVHPVKVYNSVVFKIFTEFCSQHHCLIWEHFHSLCPLVLTVLPTPSPQKPLIYCPFLVSPLLDIPCKCSDTVCGRLWWLLSFTVMFSRFVHVAAWISARPFRYRWTYYIWYFCQW